jgi:hypothetical protein
MVIVETTTFTRQVKSLLSEEEYRQLQLQLVENPTLGVKEPGTGGLRKLRVQAKGHGKSGGARMIYFWASAKDQILMLYIFPKGSRAQLTEDQKKLLKRIVDAEYS